MTKWTTVGSRSLNELWPEMGPLRVPAQGWAPVAPSTYIYTCGHCPATATDQKEQSSMTTCGWDVKTIELDCRVFVSFTTRSSVSQDLAEIRHPGLPVPVVCGASVGSAPR
eukprot:3614415-Pyramimonas_sp.AAC.1